MKTIVPIKNGRIACNDSIDRINKHFAKCKDGEYLIEIKRYYKNRTIPQNRLMWDIYNQVSEQTGYETDEIHGMMGLKFLLDQTKKTPFVKSTTKLSTSEFNTYIDRIVRFFTVEAGLIVYLPDDYKMGDSNER